MALEKKTCAQHATKIKNLATHDNYYLLQHMKTKQKIEMHTKRK